MSGNLRVISGFKKFIRRLIPTMVLTVLLIFPFSVSFSQEAKWKIFQTQGDTLYNHEDYAGAIKAFTKSINASKLKEKDHYTALYKRAVSYYHMGEFQKALNDLDTFIPKFSDSPRPLLLKAFIYREMGDDTNQLTYLQQAMDMDAVNPSLLRWRGLLFLQKDEFQKSLNDFSLARQFEDDSEVETYLGLCYYNLHKPDSAFISFNKSIELNAMYLPAYLYAGSIASEEGKYALSLEYLNLALRLDPKNKEALFYKGATLVEMEKIDEGCRCLNRAFYAGMDEAADYLKQYCFDSED